ncbi:MAG: peptidylprolyl isomerase [Microbacteriaceae bacterium]
MATNKNQDREAREARDRLKRYNARQTVNATQKKRRKRDNVIALVAVAVVIALATFFQISYFTAGPGMPVPEASNTPAPSPSPEAGKNVGDIPSPTLAEDRTWTGSLSLNSVQLGIELDGKAAPQAVSAFIQQVKNGYFVGKTCHRLVDNDAAKLIQCGSVDGTGASDPKYAFGPIENAPAGDVYTTGTIAMARGANLPYSQGHQFFITFGASTFPSDSAGGYTVIGTVTSGLDTFVSKIASGGASTEADGSTPPKIPTVITSVSVK